MRRYAILLSVCLLALGTAAADTFDFTYTGSLYSASGTLTATANGDGSFTATSGTGLYNGQAISLIANPGGTSMTSVTLGYVNYSYDDQLFPVSASPYVLDGDGLLFSFDIGGPGGATAVNICGSSNCTFNANPLTPYGSILNGSSTVTDSGKFTLKAVPEPSAAAFLGLALFGLMSLRRRFQLSPVK